MTFSFYEPAWAQHAFIRDELSKYVTYLTPRCTLHADMFVGDDMTRRWQAFAFKCCWSSLDGR